MKLFLIKFFIGAINTVNGRNYVLVDDDGERI